MAERNLLLGHYQRTFPRRSLAAHLQLVVGWPPQQTGDFGVSQALAHVRTWHPVPRAARKWPLAKLIVPLAYAVGTLVGFILTPSPRPIATLWPPNAILLSALLLTSRRKWWVLILAVLPAH